MTPVTNVERPNKLDSWLLGGSTIISLQCQQKVKPTGILFLASKLTSQSFPIAISHAFYYSYLSTSAFNAFEMKMLEVGILFDQQIFMYSRVVRKLLLSVHSDISSGDNMTRKSGTHLKCEFSTFWGPPIIGGTQSFHALKDEMFLFLELVEVVSDGW